jgi:hypothetical protein
MKCDCVLPNLFLGPDPRDEADFEQLRSMKITAILSLQTDGDLRIGDLRSRRSAATKLGLAFHDVQSSILIVPSCGANCRIASLPSTIYLRLEKSYIYIALQE